MSERERVAQKKIWEALLVDVQEKRSALETAVRFGLTGAQRHRLETEFLRAYAAWWKAIGRHAP